jgi:hypothetical protein
MRLTTEHLVKAAKALHETKERFTRTELSVELQRTGIYVAPTTMKMALTRAIAEYIIEVVDVCSEAKGQPWLFRLTNPEEGVRQAATIAVKLGGALVEGKVCLDVPAAMALAVKLNLWP